MAALHHIEFWHDHFSASRSMLLGVSSSKTAAPSLEIVSKSAEINDQNVSKSRIVNQKNPRRFRILRFIIFLFFVTISLGMLAVIFGPEIYYTVFPADPIPVVATTSGTPMGGDFRNGTQASHKNIAQPPLDPTLPDGDWLIIPRIGVYTQIQDQNEADALTKGVWRVPDFGKPGDTTMPMILAAHRFGYKWWWNSDYWRYHSFYLLPTLQPGDMVEVISNKRRYEYEIYAGEQGEQITDYSADLILYTCKFLNSPIRHFRYARLIDPNHNTQAANILPTTTNTTATLNASPSGQLQLETPVSTSSATSSAATQML